MKRKEKPIQQQVRELDQKTSDLEAMYRVLVKVQKTSLAQAERLRKLALAATKGTAVLQAGDIAPRGGYLANARAIEALADFAGKLVAFHKAPHKGRKRRP